VIKNHFQFLFFIGGLLFVPTLRIISVKRIERLVYIQPYLSVTYEKVFLITEIYPLYWGRGVIV